MHWKLNRSMIPESAFSEFCRDWNWLLSKTTGIIALVKDSIDTFLLVKNIWQWDDRFGCLHPRNQVFDYLPPNSNSVTPKALGWISFMKVWFGEFLLPNGFQWCHFQFCLDNLMGWVLRNLEMVMIFVDFQTQVFQEVSPWFLSLKFQSTNFEFQKAFKWCHVRF